MPASPLSTSPLRNRSFFKLLTFRFQISLAYQIIAVVVGWHIYQLTHDPFALGLVGLAEVIPYFCCALFAGYVVDHHSRRMFGVLASIVLSCNALVLVAVASGWTPGDAPVWIYGSIAAGGVARAFIGPSYNTLMALLLPRDQYARAAGVSSSVFQSSMILGPALGGILVGWASIAIAYSVAALLSISAAVSLFLLRIKEPPAAESAPVFSSIAEGLRFVFSNQIILGAQALDMFAVLFGGAVVYPRRFPLRAGRLGHHARRACHWCYRHWHHAGTSPLEPPRGQAFAGCRRRVRCVHHFVRSHQPFLDGDFLAGTFRYVRWGIGGDAQHHHATDDTRHHARAGLRDQRHFYRFIQ
jgi:MFS family permease